jgi:hypothetical protein
MTKNPLQIINGAMVATQRALSPEDLDQLLEALNSKHAVLDNVGGKTVISTWEPSPLDSGREILFYQTRRDIALRYENMSLDLEVPNGRGGWRIQSVPLAEWWFKHSGRAQYRTVVLAPGSDKVVQGPAGPCLNLWRSWGVEPKAGDWSLIGDHIVNVIASGNREFADYVFRWIAWSIQNPGRQAEVALVLIGEKGAGKGTLGEVLSRIFGLHTYRVDSPDDIVGTFNEHLQDMVLVIADETEWAGNDKYAAYRGRLQGMITESTIQIHPKGLKRFQIRNCLHIVMLAEPGWVVPAGRNERRYAVLDVSPDRLRDREYFIRLRTQINGDGAAAMMHDMLRVPLGDWHPRDIPDALLRSPAMRRQQQHTMKEEEQWYLTLLHDGMLPQSTDKLPRTSGSTPLLGDAWSKFPGLKYQFTAGKLRTFLVESKHRIGICCTKYEGSAWNGWTLPPLADCRTAFEAIYGPQAWDTQAEDWRPAVTPKPAPRPRVVVCTAPVPEAPPAPSPHVPFNRRGL